MKSPKLQAAWSKVKSYARNLEAIGLIVAFVVAVWHGAALHSTANKLEDTEEKLSKKLEETKATMTSVQQSMSTQSLGGFPEFTDRIVKTVQSAKRRLIVACDYAAYGEFDGRGLPIRQAIEDRINAGIPVQITILSAAQREKARRAQFPADEWTASMRSGSAYREKLMKFMMSHGYSSSTPPSHDDFIDTLESYDRVVSEQTFRGAEILQTEADMPLLFWIADDQRAVMVVQTYGGNEDSAFWTTDPRLIVALNSIASRYRQFQKPATSKRREPAAK